MIRMNAKEELTSFCGLYCGDCFFYQGKIASLAGELDKELKDVDFKETADVFAQMPFSRVFGHYDNFAEILNSLKKVTWLVVGSGKVNIRAKLVNVVVKNKLRVAGNVKNSTHATNWIFYRKLMEMLF